jgi:hypothetical protein
MMITPEKNANEIYAERFSKDGMTANRFQLPRTTVKLPETLTTSSPSQMVSNSQVPQVLASLELIESNEPSRSSNADL